MTEAPAVAIFDADSPPALTFLRSLGRAGVKAHVYSHLRFPPTRWSRYAAGFQRCPPLDDVARFLPWLRGEIQAGRIGLIAPTSDLVSFYLSELRDELPEPLQRLTPSREALLSVLMKDRFAAACEDLEVHAPATVSPHSLQEALDLAGKLRFPVLLKPRSHVGVGGARGEVVLNLEALSERYRPYPVPAGSVPLFARWPELAWPVLQEYVPGALQGLFAIAGVLDAQGRPLACAVSRKLAQWPPTLGIGTLFEAHEDDDLRSLGISIAQRLLGRGLFELELIKDVASNQYLAVDLNPRAYGQMSFEVSRGFDLPRLWYRAALGENVDPVEAPDDPGLVWLHSIPFHIGQLLGLVRGPQRRLRWARYREILRRPSVDAALDQRDPWASLAFAARLLRHPVGIARSSLAPRSGHGPGRDSAAVQPVVVK